ncbi:ribosomal protein L13 [Paraburkholderia phenoliruptrix]|nr:ribosomal protein L13 [Paraburkholderia phenoliruptrix]
MVHRLQQCATSAVSSTSSFGGLNPNHLFGFFFACDLAALEGAFRKSRPVAERFEAALKSVGGALRHQVPYILTWRCKFLYNSGLFRIRARGGRTGRACTRLDAHTTSRKKHIGRSNFFGSIMKTFSAKAHEVAREWYVIDATDKVLGRVASEVAHRLRGKHKPEFTPHVDTGDFIIVINAGKLKVTGNKTTDKKYYRHSGYPGGIYETTFGKMQERFPGRALEKAVKGMLPKGPLGYAMIKKLKVYADATHPHSAQQPKALEI